VITLGDLLGRGERMRVGLGPTPGLRSGRGCGTPGRTARLGRHRNYPMISLDNNAAEQALRRTVVIRKNAYGACVDGAARPAARIWTVTATTDMAA
jgi:hypothetical protein